VISSQSRGNQLQEQRSPKDYVVAVALSGVFGILGIQHFYLGRYLEGICDLGLSITGYYFLMNGEVGLGVLALFIDGIHTIVVTIMLLTGSFRDGDGYRVCYPGQRLNGEQ
jgi:TM2 domain-containing membrane protein YozV